MDDYARWVLMRRMTSKRQLLEVMTEFFENHLHVAAVGDPQFVHRVDYGNTIRKHALGRFDQMLLRDHDPPGDADLPRRRGSRPRSTPTRTSAGSCSSCTRVGAGHYSEKDVRDSARILTGYSVDYWESWRPKYNAEDHYRGKVKVKGFKDKNGKIIGKATTSAYLRYLAHHKDTAEHLAYKLCVKFIETSRRRRWCGTWPRSTSTTTPRSSPCSAPWSPPRPSSRHTATRCAIPARTSSRRTASSACRSSRRRRGGRRIRAPVAGLAERLDRHRAVLVGAAQRPAHRQRVVVLAGPAAGLDAVPHGRGGWADEATHYREPEQWLPGRHPRFDELVDHLCRQLLHKESTRGCSRRAASRST